MLHDMNVDRAIPLLEDMVMPLAGEMKPVLGIIFNLKTFSNELPFLMRIMPAISPLQFTSRFGES